MTVGQLQHYCQLPTRYQILGYSQWITNQAALCELNKIWPRDSNAWACCLFIVYNVSDSQRLAMCHKPGRHPWAETNTAKRFQCQSLLLPIVYNMSDSRGLKMHRKLHSCLWAGYTDSRTVIKLNFDHSRIQNFTPKREPNRYISSKWIATT